MYNHCTARIDPNSYGRAAPTPNVVTRDEFQTLADRGQASFEVRGSEFFGQVVPVDSVEGAETVVTKVRKDHPKATHNVPAYRVRASPLREYSNDDGEPSGSAGAPMLNVLKGKNLKNVVAVVTRYFGGTELGVGGLAQAYSQAVSLAIEDAGICTYEPRERFTIVIDYDDSGTVRGILNSTESTFEAAYEERVKFVVTVPTSHAGSLKDRIRSATNGRVNIE